MAEKEHKYAIGNKTGPVMIDGTVWKSQKDYNKMLGISIIIAGLVFSGMSYSNGLDFGIYLGIIIAGLGAMLFSSKKIKPINFSFFQNKKQTWAIVIVIAVVIILGFITFYPSSNKSTASANITKMLSIGNSPVLGDAGAPVTIYEFSDFSCPFCAAAEGYNNEVAIMLKSKSPSWQAPLPEIKKEYVDKGEVKIVFKYYPGHGSASAAHAVAAGLKEQSNELFWKFADKAFAGQDSMNLNDINAMELLAKSLGDDDAKLREYISSQKFNSQLSDDIAMGKAVGIRGTPTFFINGEIVEGAQPFSVFKEIIDKQFSS